METKEEVTDYPGAFNADRVLKLVRNDRELNKIWQKVHPQDNRNNSALRSIYNAMILGDRKYMELYVQTK